jgi:hypothetical protein
LDREMKRFRSHFFAAKDTNPTCKRGGVLGETVSKPFVQGEGRRSLRSRFGSARATASGDILRQATIETVVPYLPKIIGVHWRLLEFPGRFCKATLIPGSMSPAMASRLETLHLRAQTFECGKKMPFGHKCLPASNLRVTME